MFYQLFKPFSDGKTTFQTQEPVDELLCPKLRLSMVLGDSGLIFSCLFEFFSCELAVAPFQRGAPVSRPHIECLFSQFEQFFDPVLSSAQYHIFP